MAAGEVKDLEKSTHPPCRPSTSTPPLAEEGQCCVITGGGRRRCSALTAGAPIVDHMAPPPLPSAALLKLRDPVKDRQAAQKGRAGGDKEKSTATVALSASGLDLVLRAPGDPEPPTYTTDPFEASTRPALEVTIL